MLRLVRTLSTQVPSYKVAIVGSGPSGFYTAYHLLSKASKYNFKVHVDFFEKLPTPFGLSRYGVAPDHPEVKNCETYLRDLMVDYTDKTRFFGNVEIGKDVFLSDLAHHYHSICLSYGCVSGDNMLTVPGSTHPNVISARLFVNWYNGHPDVYTKPFKPPDLINTKTVTIIGNGNVALDVARVLLIGPSHWQHTDITQDALSVLQKSSVTKVNIVARRGLLQSAFTTKEIRELFELSKSHNVSFVPIDPDIWDPFVPQINTFDRPNKRKFATIQKYHDSFTQTPKSWSLQYLKTPKEFVVENGKLTKTVFTKNQIVSDPNGERILATNDSFDLQNDLVILSMGYRGSPLPLSEQHSITFDSNRSRIINKGGRVVDEFENVVPGIYTSGWIKNGPKGIIATTMMDSFDTGVNILEDLSNHVFLGTIHKPDIQTTLNKEAVSWKDWLRLDKYEIHQGKMMDKVRDKVVDIDQMLKIVHRTL